MSRSILIVNIISRLKLSILVQFTIIFAFSNECFGQIDLLPTGSIALPSVVIDSEDFDRNLRRVRRLFIDPGGTEELPNGPISFDASYEGLYIYNPVQRAILLFDFDGNWLENFYVAEPLSRIWKEKDNHNFIAQKATNDRYFRFLAYQRVDAMVSEHLPITELIDRSEIKIDSSNTVLLSDQQGLILKNEDSEDSDPIEVFVENNELLLSIEEIIAKEDDYTYVAIEKLMSEEDLRIFTELRVYDSFGEHIISISGISQDFYVVPTDQFRVYNRTIYQLIPHLDEVLIKYWDIEMTSSGR